MRTLFFFRGGKVDKRFVFVPYLLDEKRGGSVMKKVLGMILIAIALLISLGCLSSAVIYGNGNRKTKSFPLSHFHSVDLRLKSNVLIQQGEQFSVVLSFDENLEELLDVSVNPVTKTLILTKKREVPVSHTKFTLEITMPQLISFSSAGTSDTEIKGFTQWNDSFQLQLLGSGSITADCFAKKSSLFIGGSGKISLTGETEELVAQIHGSGTISSKELKAQTVSCDLFGSGEVSVAVEKELRSQLSGSATLYYLGDPSIIDLNQSGFGRVKKLSN